MSSFRYLPVVLAALCLGCSATNDSSDDGVWDANSSGFTLDVSGGFTNEQVLFSYEVATRSLQRTCSNHCFVDGAYTTSSERSIELSSAQSAELDELLATLEETMERSCGADAPDMTLSIEDPDGNTSYESNFYAGCSGADLSANYIDWDSLSALEQRLDLFLQE